MNGNIGKERRDHWRSDILARNEKRKKQFNFTGLNPKTTGVYRNDGKSDVHDNHHFHQINKQSKNVMVSACLTWNN